MLIMINYFLQFPALYLNIEINVKGETIQWYKTLYGKLSIELHEPHTKLVIRILADSSHVIQCNALSSDEANDQSILYMLQFLFSNSSRTATASSTLIYLMKTCGCDNLIPSCYLKLGESILPLSTVILLDRIKYDA
jgi:hypothetical protein